MEGVWGYRGEDKGVAMEDVWGWKSEMREVRDGWGSEMR